MNTVKPDNQAIGVPGVAMVASISYSVPDGAPMTLSNQITPFEQVKHLLSDKPLHRPNRTRPIDDDERDAQAAREALREGGAVALADFETQLGS